LFGLSLLLLGCQSRAEYPTCGNGILDGNEQCDQTNLHGQTCVDRGYTGGTLTCDDFCYFDESGCIGAGDCDPLTNAGCFPGKYCYYNPDNDQLECASEGNLTAGETCGASKSCSAQMVCVNSTCWPICSVGDPCGESDHCPDAGWPEEWSYCSPSTGDCRPIEQTGCPSGKYCYVTSQFGDFQCLSASTGEHGDSCTLTQYCAPGHICGYGVDDVCHQYCRQEADCPEGGWCNQQFSWPDGVGFCVDRY
jgi:hypothetical protein